MLILKIVGGVVLTLVILIVAAYFWLKRKATQFITGYSASVELVDPTLLAPARLRLERSAAMEHDEATTSLIQSLNPLKFQPLVDFDDLTSGQVISAFRHRELPIAAVVMPSALAGSDPEPRFMVFSAYRDKTVYGFGNGPIDEVRLRRLEWLVDDASTPADALERVRRHGSESPLPVTERLVQSVLEQVYAIAMDWRLRVPPSRADIVSRARTLELSPSDRDIEGALEIAFDHWCDQIRETALDRYRRQSRVDAVRWERIEGNIDVVHDNLSDDALEYMLIDGDEKVEAVYEQLQAEDLSGSDLFAAMQRELPAETRRTVIATLQQPFPISIYALPESPPKDSGALQRFLYSGTGHEDQSVEGIVVGLTTKHALRHLKAIGVGSPRLLLAPSEGLADELPGDLNPSDMAALAQTLKQSGWRTALRAFTANWLLWIPTTALLIKSLLDGAPFTWGDYVVFGLFALSIFAVTVIVGPVIAFDRVQAAKLYHKPKIGLLALRVVRTLNVLGGATPQELLGEQTRLLAMDGRADDAMVLLDSHRAELGESGYYAALGQVHDATGDWDQMIAAQRESAKASPDQSVQLLDLALSIARHSSNKSEAARLLARLDAENLAELPRLGYDYARGLLAADRAELGKALAYYAQALEACEQFAGNPFIHALIAEINAYAAIALKRSGRDDEAHEVWDSAWSILAPHPQGVPLLAQFERA